MITMVLVVHNMDLLFLIWNRHILWYMHWHWHFFHNNMRHPYIMMFVDILGYMDESMLVHVIRYWHELRYKLHMHMTTFPTTISPTSDYPMPNNKLTVLFFMWLD